MLRWCKNNDFQLLRPVIMQNGVWFLGYPFDQCNLCYSYDLKGWVNYLIFIWCCLVSFLIRPTIDSFSLFAFCNILHNSKGMRRPWKMSYLHRQWNCCCQCVLSSQYLRQFFILKCNLVFFSLNSLIKIPNILTH